jgi:hypothetical protein
MRIGWILLCASCTFEWNSGAPPYPLTGEAPALDSFEKLNNVPAARTTILTGVDGAPWAAFCEFWTGNLTGGGSARQCKRYHLHALGGASVPACAPRCSAAAHTDELLDADAFSIHDKAIFLLRDADDGLSRTVVMHRPGDGNDVAFVMPPGRALVYPDDDADVFVYWITEPPAMQYTVFRRDRKYQLTLPVPTGADIRNPGTFDFLLTKDGNTLVVADPATGLTAYSTLDGSSRLLRPTAPTVFFIDDVNAAVVTAGDDGLRSIPLAGGPENVLAGHIGDTLQVVGEDVFWPDSGGLFWVRLDGSVPPTLIAAGGARLLATSPDGQVVYSRDDALRYTRGAGDGWIGDWRFMERGRTVRFAPDGKRVYFLEHAATVGDFGDLTSADLGGLPRLLSINVHNYAVLADGRVLALENAVLVGVWNRLVVFDEAAGTKKWVVPAAADFVMTPAGDQMLVDVVSGASGYDILRVPITKVP